MQPRWSDFTGAPIHYEGERVLQHRTIGGFSVSVLGRPMLSADEGDVVDGSVSYGPRYQEPACYKDASSQGESSGSNRFSGERFLNVVRPRQWFCVDELLDTEDLLFERVEKEPFSIVFLFHGMYEDGYGDVAATVHAAEAMAAYLPNSTVSISAMRRPHMLEKYLHDYDLPENVDISAASDYAAACFGKEIALCMSADNREYFAINKALPAIEGIVGPFDTSVSSPPIQIQITEYCQGVGDVEFCFMLTPAGRVYCFGEAGFGPQSVGIYLPVSLEETRKQMNDPGKLKSVVAHNLGLPSSVVNSCWGLSYNHSVKALEDYLDLLCQVFDMRPELAMQGVVIFAFGAGYSEIAEKVLNFGQYWKVVDGPVTESDVVDNKALIIFRDFVPHADFARILAASDLPVNITGNCTLSTAIALDKVFLWRARPFQDPVGSSLIYRMRMSGASAVAERLNAFIWNGQPQKALPIFLDQAYQDQYHAFNRQCRRELDLFQAFGRVCRLLPLLRRYALSGEAPYFADRQSGSNAFGRGCLGNIDSDHELQIQRLIEKGSFVHVHPFLDMRLSFAGKTAEFRCLKEGIDQAPAEGFVYETIDDDVVYFYFSSRALLQEMMEISERIYGIAHGFVVPAIRHAIEENRLIDNGMSWQETHAQAIARCGDLVFKGFTEEVIGAQIQPLASTITVVSDTSRAILLDTLGVDNFLERCFFDENRRARAKKGVQNFLDISYAPKDAMFTQVDSLSDVDKISAIRELIQYSVALREATPAQMTLGQWLLLEDSPDAGALHHVLGRFIQEFLAGEDEFDLFYRELLDTNEDYRQDSLAKWRIVYLLLWAAALKSKELGNNCYPDSRLRWSEFTNAVIHYTIEAQSQRRVIGRVSLPVVGRPMLSADDEFEGRDPRSLMLPNKGGTYPVWDGGAPLPPGNRGIADGGSDDFFATYGATEAFITRANEIYDLSDGLAQYFYLDQEYGMVPKASSPRMWEPNISLAGKQVYQSWSNKVAELQLVDLHGNLLVNLLRGRGFLILGPSRAGKSMVSKYLFTSYPDVYSLVAEDIFSLSLIYPLPIAGFAYPLNWKLFTCRGAGRNNFQQDVYRSFVMIEVIFLLELDDTIERVAIEQVDSSAAILALADKDEYFAQNLSADSRNLLEKCPTCLIRIPHGYCGGNFATIAACLHEFYVSRITEHIDKRNEGFWDNMSPRQCAALVWWGMETLPVAEFALNVDGANQPVQVKIKSVVTCRAPPRGLPKQFAFFVYENHLLTIYISAFAHTVLKRVFTGQELFCVYTAIARHEYAHSQGKSHQEAIEDQRKIPGYGTIGDRLESVQDDDAGILYAPAIWGRIFGGEVQFDLHNFTRALCATVAAAKWNENRRDHNHREDHLCCEGALIFSFLLSGERAFDESVLLLGLLACFLLLGVWQWRVVNAQLTGDSVCGMIVQYIVNMKGPVFISISGKSGVGKSTFAAKLGRLLRESNFQTKIISGDHYIRGAGAISWDETGLICGLAREAFKEGCYVVIYEEVNADTVAGKSLNTLGESYPEIIAVHIEMDSHGRWFSISPLNRNVSVDRGNCLPDFPPGIILGIGVIAVISSIWLTNVDWTTVLFWLRNIFFALHPVGVLHLWGGVLRVVMVCAGIFIYIFFIRSR